MRGKIQLRELMENNRLDKLGGGGGFHAKIFERITSKVNLFAAWREFQNGKMRKGDVLTFAEHFETHLLELYTVLVSGTYQHGKYTTFFVHDPKQRRISKPSVRDRVLHHAICRVLMPLFDRPFIFDSYSSRKGKGTHSAINRFRGLALSLSQNNTKTVWILKCDIRKFFESVDHNILLRLCAIKISDQKLLALLEKIIRSFEAKPGKGIPLGNLTSQLLANIYLDQLDQYVKRELRCKNYVRYTDDFVLLSQSQTELEEMLPKIRGFLQEKLLIELHPDKVLFKRWHAGIDFLGFVHFPHFRVVRTKTKKRILRKLPKRQQEVLDGTLGKEAFEQVKQSYLGVLSHGRNKQLSRHIRKKFMLEKPKKASERPS